MSSVVVDQTNPWPGLSSFDEQQRDFFCGREVEVAELLRLVKRETLTVLFGQSGLGKTSLLQAGLFPPLRREDFLPVYIRLKYVKRDDSDVSLARQLKLDLGAALQAAEIEVEPPGDETLWEYFHREDREFWSKRNHLVTPVLVFDQFEEIFTLGRASNIPAAWINELLDELHSLVQHTVPASVRARLEADPSLAARFDFDRTNVKIIFSFREDFLPEFEGLRAQFPAITQNRFRLQRLKGNQALEVITKPARELIDRGVALEIINFVSYNRQHQVAPLTSEAELANREIEPALLSVVCRELNNRRIRRGQARISAEDLTSREQILKEFYERAMEGIDIRVRVFLEDKLLTVAGYRTRVPRADATDQEHNPGVTEQTIQTLIDRRLLRQEESGGVVWIELIHDLLTGVILASRDERKQREKIERDQREMEERQKRQSDLIRQEADKKTHRYRIRAQRLAWVAALIGIGVIIWTAYYKNEETSEIADINAKKAALIETKNQVIAQQEKQAEIEAALYHAQATSNLMSYYAQLGRQAYADGRFDEAALCFGEIYRNDSTNNAVNEYQLWQALFMGERDVDSVVMEGLPARITSADFSANGKLALAGADGSVQVWQLDEAAVTTRLVVVFHGPNVEYIRTRFAQDGARVICLDASSRIYAWDLTNAAAQQIVAASTIVASLEVDPAGAKMVTICPDGSSKVWNTADLTETTIFSASAGVANASFSHDGKWLVTVSITSAIELWDVEKRVSAKKFASPVTGAKALLARFDRADRNIVVGYDDGRVAVLSLNAGNDDSPAKQARFDSPLTTIEPGGSNGFWLAVSPHRITVWNALDASTQPVSQFICEGTNFFRSARFDQSGNFIITAETNETTQAITSKIWDARNGQNLDTVERLVFAKTSADGGHILTVRAAEADSRGARGKVWRVDRLRLPRILTAAKGGVISAAFIADTSAVATMSSAGSLRRWDSEQEKPLAEMATNVSWVELNGSATQALAIDPGGKAWFWNATNARPMTGLPYQSETATCAALSPDGRYVAIGTREGGWSKWSSATGELAKKSATNFAPVTSIQFHPVFDLLLTVNGNRAVLWRGRDGSKLNEYKSGACQVAAFDPAGMNVALGLANGDLAIHDFLGVPIKKWNAHQGRVLGLKFNPDGRLLASLGEDGKIRVWDFPGGRLHATLAALNPGQKPVVLAFSRDSELLASGCADHRARVWKIKTGDCLEEFRGYGGPVTTVEFSPDGRQLLAACRTDGAAKLWNIFADTQDQTNMQHCLRRIDRDIAWHFDSAHQLVPGSMRSDSLAYALDGELNPCSNTNLELLRAQGLLVERARQDLLDSKISEALVSLEAAKSNHADWASVEQLLAEAKRMSLGLNQTLPPTPGRVRDLKFSPSGKQLLIGSFGAPTMLLDLASNQINVLNYAKSDATGGPARSDWTVAFSPDGHLAAAAGGKDGRDGTLGVWDTENFTNVTNLRLDSLPSKIDFSKSGFLLVVTQDGQARLWNSTNGALNTIAPGKNSNAAPAFAFSPDGAILALGYESGSVKLINLPEVSQHGPGAVDGTELQGLNTKVAWLDFDAASRRLAAAAGASSMGIWELKDKPGFRPIPCAATMERVMFSPDGSQLAGLSTNGQAIEVWDAAALTNKSIQRLDLGPINDMAFDDTGHRVLVASKNFKVVIWDTQSGAVSGILQGQEHPFVRAAFSPDKKTIATGSGNAIHLWDADQVLNSPLQQAWLDAEGGIVASAFQRSAGQFIVAITNDQGLCLIRAGLTNAALAKPMVLESGFTPGAAIFATLSPDGNWLLANASGNLVGIWNTQNRRRACTLTNESTVAAMTASAAASFAATADAAGVSLWNLATGARVSRFANPHNAAITGLAFNPSGDGLLTIGRDHTARLWDCATGSVKLCFIGDFEKGWFSGDGHRVILSHARNSPAQTQNANGAAEIWDTRTGKFLDYLGGEDEGITSVEFTPDARFILTAGAQMAKLWDYATAKELDRFDLHTAPVLNCTWSDEKQLVSLSSDGWIWKHGVIASTAP